jgi:hypothetical protein
MSLLKVLNLPLPKTLAASARPANLLATALPPTGGPAAPLASTPVSLAIRRPDTIELGSRHQLSVAAFMSDQSLQDFTRKATWTSSDTSLLTVSADGVANALHVSGTVTVTAAAPGGKPRDSIDVTLRAHLESIVVTPKNQLVELGKDYSNAYFVATALYADGTKEDISGRVLWETDLPDAVEVMNMGGWAAKAAGDALIRATHLPTKLSDLAKFTVVAPGKAPRMTAIAIEPLNPEPKNGETVQFTATGTFADKAKRDVTRQVAWESAKPAVLDIDPDLGLAQPMTQGGSSLVRALDQATGLHASTTVYVESPDVVKIETADVVLDEGETTDISLTAVLRGGGRIPLKGRIQWQSDDATIADILPGGRYVFGAAAGTTNIEVTEPQSGKTATFEVKVNPPGLVQVIVFPLDQTVAIGDSIPFMALGRMTNGKTRPLTRPLWTSSASAVVSVDQKGAAVALQAGDAVIQVEDRATHMTRAINVKVLP